MNNTVDILVSLGQRLDSFGRDARTERCITEAIAANGWFTREDIMMAVDAIRTEFLQRDKLETWRDRFMQVEHKYPDIFIRLTLFHCVISEGVPQALEHNALRWIHPSETKNFTFCPADTDILKEIGRVYGGSKPL